ncbi:MAG: hypothetical protein ABIJ23_00580 [Candidatus Magasanikbacteria bacterium]
MSEEIMKKLKEYDKRFDGVDKRFDEHGQQLDLLAIAVLSNTERLDRIEENMATKKDLSEMNKTLDEILGYVKKKDQELTFMGVRVKRNENDIKVIKPLVGLSVEV